MTAAMLPSGSREADILRGGWGDAPDDEGGERAGGGGDEDIDPEGEMAEDTQEGCAADWHAWVGADWGGDNGDYIVAVVWIFLCQTSRVPRALRSGVTGVWD